MSPDGTGVFAVRYDDWFGHHRRSPGDPNHDDPARWRGMPGSVDQPDWMRCN